MPRKSQSQSHEKSAKQGDDSVEGIDLLTIHTDLDEIKQTLNKAITKEELQKCSEATNQTK